MTNSPGIKQRVVDRFTTPLPMQSISLLVALSFSIYCSLGYTQLWDYFDPLFYLLVDGKWEYVYLVEYIITGTVIWVIAFKLDLSVFGTPRLAKIIALAWSPYAMWALLSSFWSAFPLYSLLTWGQQIWIASSVCALSATAISNHHADGNLYKEVLAGFSVVSVATFFVGNDLGKLPPGLDTVVFGTWFSYLICTINILLLKSIASNNDTSKKVLLFHAALCLSLCALPIIINSRMVWLILLTTSLACIIFIVPYRKGIEYKKQIYGYLILCAQLLFSINGFLFTAKTKYSPVASITKYQAQEHWLLATFVNNERWQIFSFYIEQGIKSLWVGVGYGWKLPMFNYSKFQPGHFDSMWASHGHNLLLNNYLQVGLIGLFAFVFMLVFLALPRFGKSITLTLDQKVSHFGVLLLTAVMLLKNFTDDGHRDGTIVFFCLWLGLFLGWTYQKKPLTTVSEMVIPPQERGSRK